MRPLMQIVLEEDDHCSYAAVAVGQILGSAENPELAAPIWESLLTALKDEELEVRERASAALGPLLLAYVPDASFSQRAVASLIEALHDDNHQVHTRAAHVLARVFPSDSDRPRPEVSRNTIEDLLAALQHNCANVRQFVATALGRVLAEGADPSFQQSATESLLSWLEDPKDPNNRETIHEAAISALGRIISASKSIESAQRAVPLFIAALGDEQQPMRFRASRALGLVVSAVADPELAQMAGPALITALRDNDASVRERVAESLGRIFAAVPDPGLAEMAIQPLIETLEAADSLGERNKLAWALAQIDSKKAREAVLKAGFDHDNPPSPPSGIR